MATGSVNDRVKHNATGGEYFVIFIINFLLTVLTLGIYSFWAKARTRRYLWSHTSFDNEQFEYDGNGMEMFIGFLKATGIMILVGIGLVVLSSLLSMVAGIFGYLPLVLAYLFLVFVAPSAALYGARRYILSRTRYRSVRFAVSGSALKYGFKAFGYAMLSLLTLGLHHPFSAMKLQTYRTNRTTYGSEPMSFDGRGQDIFTVFLIAWLLTIPTLGLVWFWYAAKVAQYEAQHTRLGDLRFNTTFTTGPLMWLYFSNLLMIVFTLGLAFPWAVVRSMNFKAQHLQVAGDMDFAKVKQATEKASATNEGFAEAMDVDFGI